MGVLRWQLWLDRLIEHYARRKALDPDVRLILRLGLYQLRFLDRVPASAAVNESVNLAYFARLRSAAPFVNGVLRNVTRDPNFDPVSSIEDPLERLAVGTSHPLWLIERWADAFGASEAENFARSNNEAPPMSFRVVRKRSTDSNVLDELQLAGAEITASRIRNGAWRVSAGAERLGDLVAEGRAYVQDEASQLVADALEAEPRHRVLDLCAAPGSKTTQIADLTNDAATIVASDRHAHRLTTVVRTAQMQGLSSIHPLVVDGLRLLPFLEGHFDRVLVDAPCSGTGTLRRNPEIRWRISPDDIRDLVRRQKLLLLNAASVVKPGGRLVYSTCSVEPEENEGVVNSFLENHDQFRIAKLNVDTRLVTPLGAARTWPQRDGCDGFFLCAFERKVG
jgi:16S rRNA (cytosine967-C5)-methyltransferase